MATKKITKQEAKKLAIKAGVNFKKDYFEQDITTVLKNIGALQDINTQNLQVDLMGKVISIIYKK